MCIDEHEGQSCGATTECGKLKCVRNVCVAPNSVPVVVRPRAEDAKTSAEDAKTMVDGVHPFFGLTAMAGPSIFGITIPNFGLADEAPQGSALFALRGGVYLGHHELAVEMSPMTYAWYPNTGGPSFQFNVTYAFHLTLAEGRKVGVYWPLRLGVGAVAGNTFDTAFFQTRLTSSVSRSAPAT